VTYVAITEFETRLHWRSESGALLSGDRAPAIPLGAQVSCMEEKWNPEALLVGAVEGRTLLAFLEKARAAGVQVLFYQSSAVARRVDGPDGLPHYTDLIVRPHVAVRGEKDATIVRSIFEALPECCFPSSMLRLTPRIEPIIDIWDEQHAAALEEDRRHERQWRWMEEGRAAAHESR
jgi:organic hydroperoxide reductase OsmC/OhrA